MSKLTLINHSSILFSLNNEETFILTDFWNESPAFGSWLPSALPFYNPIYLAALSYQKNFYLAISHAHDDHIDDYFLKKYFNKNLKIIISEYPSPSLRNRIKNLGFENIFQVGRNIKKIDNFEVISIFDSQISGDDSGLAFRDNNFCIYHGNDNWFEMKNKNIDYMKSFKGNRTLLYASQTNTASGHPMTYPQFDEEIDDQIKNKVKKMLISGLNNSKNLSAEYFLPYAGFSKAYVKDEDYHTKAFDPLYENLKELVKYEKINGMEKMIDMFCGGTIDLKNGKITYPFPISPEKLIKLTSHYFFENEQINKCDSFRKDFENDDIDYKFVEIYLKKFNQFVLNYLEKKPNFYPSIIGKKIKFTIKNTKNSKNLFSKCIEIGSGHMFENFEKPNKEFVIPQNLFKALIEKKIVFENLYTGYQAKVYRYPKNVYNRDIIMYLDMFGYVYAKKIDV